MMKIIIIIIIISFIYGWVNKGKKPLVVKGS